MELTNTKQVIAIDFGTSNTYVSRCPGGDAMPGGVDFGGGRDGLATAILYREGKRSVIGDKAVEEFGDAEGTPEFQSYTIQAQFKPDIAHSKKACKYSTDFLSELLKWAEDNQVTLQPLASQVIFGAPSESSIEYRNTLKHIAANAGFGDIQIIDEPKGAVYFHIHAQDITPAEAAQGALVVDFGGGTCDFALIVKGEVKHSWGEMHLGGRLFDDLFYQWFSEQNPDALEDIRHDHKEFYVLWHECRKVKEKFSQDMRSDRKGTFRKKIDSYGHIKDVTWDKFLIKARSYHPSPTFANYLRQMNPAALNKFVDGGNIDILEWFSQILREGLRHEKVRDNRVSCVVLTGGSSSWLFVDEIVEQEMGGIWSHKPRFLRSDRPYATISQGLSIIPFLQRRFESITSKLQEEMADFIANKVNPVIENRIQKAAQNIADSVATSLFDKRIRPILVDFRNKGGAVSRLKQRIASESELFQSQVKTIVEQEMQGVLITLPGDIVGLMEQWFKQHGLVFNQSGERLKGSKTENKTIVIAVDVYGGIEATIGYISVAIVTAVVSMISGGAGTALIATGPLGLAIGAILGLVIGAAIVVEGLERAKEKAENWEGCPLWILNKALSDNKISAIRLDVKEQVKNKVLEHVDQAKLQLAQYIEKYVKHEVESLSAINQL